MLAIHNSREASTILNSNVLTTVFTTLDTSPGTPWKTADYDSLLATPRSRPPSLTPVSLTISSKVITAHRKAGLGGGVPADGGPDRDPHKRNGGIPFSYLVLFTDGNARGIGLTGADGIGEGMLC
ncbi:hypothetical protein P154DRAFT_582131 [Amniculicola lignicola CBS 123094]|uniref:Uncharacterized protein n=1 Tax=Amniculicola lignicola CBS 123094 TaxID=1392246 RepID=A0A6A5W8Z3_9PLEO|nr:hypothetical protein P154DRAFT_582131 [Amniculicola lignicola CBS 123094]